MSHDLNGYTNQGCRCDVCKQASRDYRTKYEATDSYREKQSRYAKSEKCKQANRRNAALYKQRHPEKLKAHQAVHNALRRGDLTRLSACEHCGASGKTEASHTDYANQLDVEWLCKKCHTIKDRPTT